MSDLERTKIGQAEVSELFRWAATRKFDPQIQALRDAGILHLQVAERSFSKTSKGYSLGVLFANGYLSVETNNTGEIQGAVRVKDGTEIANYNKQDEAMMKSDLLDGPQKQTDDIFDPYIEVLYAIQSARSAWIEPAAAAAAAAAAQVA